VVTVSLAPGLIELTPDEWKPVKSQFVTSPKGGGKVKLPMAFTERGLYMLATILKSPQAVGTTIAIIDTFAKIKELTQTVYQLAKAKTNEQKVKIFENSTSIMADLLDNELTVSQLETDIKISSRRRVTPPSSHTTVRALSHTAVLVKLFNISHR